MMRARATRASFAPRSPRLLPVPSMPSPQFTAAIHQDCRTIAPRARQIQRSPAVRRSKDWPSLCAATENLSPSRVRQSVLENVGLVPAQPIQGGPRRQEAEAALRQLAAPFPLQDRVQLVLQLMQIEDIGGGVFQLVLRQGLRP